MKRRLVVASLLVLVGTGFGFSQEGRATSPGDELYDELAASLDRAEARVAATVLQDGVVVSAEELEALITLNRQIRGSLYGDLIDRSDLLLLQINFSTWFPCIACYIRGFIRIIIFRYSCT